jgi:pre-60S factor REI1
MSTLICNACQSPIASDAERATHYKSEWHRYNVKRRCAGLTSIPQSLFDSQLAALQSKKAAESAAKSSQRCAACKKSFQTASAFQAHLQTKKHLKKVEKQNDAADEEGEEDEDDEMGSAEKPVAAASAASAAAAPSAAAPAAPASSSKKPVKAESKHDDGSDDEDAMSDDGEDEEEEGEAIPLLSCLFCAKSFPTVQASVEHMLKQHGFFIPFVENLVDLEGLLTYLGEKIGIGHVCLWSVKEVTRGGMLFPLPSAPASGAFAHSSFVCILVACVLSLPLLLGATARVVRAILRLLQCRCT